MSEQRKDKQKPAQIVRPIAKLTGTLAANSVDVGKKVSGLGVFGKAKAQVAALETELVTVNTRLAETQEETRKTQSQLVSLIKALQEENESLNSALKQARNKARGVKIKEDKIATLETELGKAKSKQARNKARGAKIKEAKIATLETELAKAKSKLAETQKKGKETQSQLTSQLDALQKKNKSLNYALKYPREEARGAEIEEGDMSERVATQETELVKTNSELAETQDEEKVEST